MFEFADINLAETSMSNIENCGFVKFSVLPKPSLVINDVIENKATIFFDYYNAYETNSTSTVVNTNGMVTPLKFVSYYLKLQTETNNIRVENKWQTANEENVRQFNILRSFDGNEFRKIGVVSANNNSINEYNFIDEKVTKELLNSSINNVKLIYYKIEAVDKDGTKAFSQTKKIELKNNLENFSIYPNPAKSFININSTLQIQSIKIVDAVGRIVLHQKNQNFIDIKKLEKGIYILLVQSTLGNLFSSKFYKEN